ncbi:MAG TPA: LacI family DNA-binding transcriptional regulator [Devosiaceae bacterium]
MESDDKSGKGRSVRVEDVAREAGVSPITVSRALSTPDIVKAETRERVMRAVQKTGYVVNTYASSLRSGRSSIVSMFVANIANPHVTQVIRGCAEALAGSGLHLTMTQLQTSNAIDAEVIAAVLPLRPAALVFTGRLQLQSARDLVKARGIPVVETWDYYSDPIDMVVGFCHTECGRQMGEHLGSAGFRHIAYVGSTTSRAGKRLKGFQEGLAKHGRDIGHILTLSEPLVTDVGRRALDLLFDEYPSCDAAFFSNDIWAVGAALHAQTSAVPALRNLAIAGCGDIGLAADLPVPITTMRTSGYDLGMQVGRMLQRRLDGESQVKAVKMQTELLVRASTERRVSG